MKARGKASLKDSVVLYICLLCTELLMAVLNQKEEEQLCETLSPGSEPALSFSLSLFEPFLVCAGCTFQVHNNKGICRITNVYLTARPNQFSFPQRDN